VPAGERVPRRGLESLLADSYIGQCAAWSWTTLGDGAWPAFQFYSIAAKREVADAVEDGVLIVSTMVVERPPSHTWLDRLLAAVGRPPLFAHRPGHALPYGLLSRR